MNDFWRMVWERESKCIVMLCDLIEDEEVKSIRFKMIGPNLIISGLHILNSVLRDLGNFLQMV